MKNVGHPNMLPTAGGSSVAETQVITDADVGGIGATPAPSSAWANPIAAFQKPSTAAATDSKHATRADQVIAYLREHGPSAGADICKALGITSKGGLSPFIQPALKDGRILRVDGKYIVGGEDTVQPSTEAATPPLAVSHFEAASAIVAMRKQRTPKLVDAPPAPAPAPAPASEPAPAFARKPDFVVFVGDVQLLAWPDGDLTIQTDACTVDLKPQHFRALMTLVELRK